MLFVSPFMEFVIPDGDMYLACVVEVVAFVGVGLEAKGRQNTFVVIIADVLFWVCLLPLMPAIGLGRGRAVRWRMASWLDIYHRWLFSIMASCGAVHCWSSDWSCDGGRKYGLMTIFITRQSRGRPRFSGIGILLNIPR